MDQIQAREQAILDRIQRDPHRPQYHFLPAANWMNDPNGLIQWEGDYHLFYQYNPEGPFHGTIHWGHAVSRDLVHWEDWPIALAPTPNGPDKDGCYSGCAVNNDGVPTLVYTGIRPEVQMIATSDNGLRTWAKHPDNPVIGAPPNGLPVTGFRDPFVWKEEDGWYCVVGSGIEGEGGTLFLYRSPDLVNWEYLHRMSDGDPSETGTMWECPNFFPLGDKHVLLISPIPLRKSIYAVGAYADHRFEPDLWDDLDAGGHFYAPQVMRDDQGRWLMWGWIWEGREQDAAHAAGWNGVMSLPRILSLGDDGTLRYQPVPELKALRSEHWQRRDLTVTAGSTAVDGVGGAALEIEATIDPGDAESCGLRVACSADGAESTEIRWSGGVLSIDRTRSSASISAHKDVHSVPLSLATGEPLRLHVFLDHSVLEVFANGRRCLTSRIYPRADSTGIQLFADGGTATVSQLDVWSMRSIWTTAREIQRPQL